MDQMSPSEAEAEFGEWACTALPQYMTNCCHATSLRDSFSEGQPPTHGSPSFANETAPVRCDKQLVACL